MHLRSVKLQNFRHHVKTEITFKDGITAFVGPNGSGKSTIFEAIAFAIYGTGALRTKAKQAVSILAPADDFLVELVLVVNGDEIWITRSAQTAKLSIRGRTVAQGSQDVTDYVTRLFRLNLDQFTSAFYTEQKKLEFLSRHRSRIDRENFILEILGYNVVDQFIDEIRREKKEVKYALTAQPEVDEASIKLAINQLQIEVSELHTKKNKASEELDEIRTEISSLNAKLESYHNKKTEFEKLQIKLQALEESIKDIPKRPDIEEIRLIEQQIQGLRNHLEETSESIQKSETSTTEELNSVKAEILSLESWRKQIHRDIQIFESLILKLDDGLATCPTCGQLLSDPRTAREHLSAKLLNLKKSKSEAEQQLKQLELTVAQLNDRLATIAKQKEDLRDQQQQLVALENKKMILQQKLSDSAEWERRKAQIEKESVELKEQLDLLRVDAEHARALEVRLTGLQNKEKTLLVEMASIQTAIAERTKAIENYEKQFQEARRINSKREQLVERHVHLELADKLMTEFRLRISEKVRPHLSELASNYLTRLTNGKITAIQLDKTFDFTALCGVDEVPLLSGGEEDVVSLSLRLALSEMILAKSGISFEILILDEIFGHLDSDRRTELLQLLVNLKNTFKQIFIISHIEDVQNYADNVVLFEYDSVTGDVRVRIE